MTVIEDAKEFLRMAHIAEPIPAIKFKGAPVEDFSHDELVTLVQLLMAKQLPVIS